MAVILITITGLWQEPPVVGAQQLPAKAFSGMVTVDSKRAADGTAITAYVDGIAVGKGVVKGGVYKLLVQQPQGTIFKGKYIRFTIGSKKAAETHAWGLGGRAQELNLNTGVGITGQPETPQQTMECMLSTLGRLPSGPQDLTGQERIRLLKECPNFIRNLGALNNLSQTAPTPQTNQTAANLQKIRDQIARLTNETPIKIQQELDQHNRTIAKSQNDLSKELQMNIDVVNRKLSDTTRRKAEELSKATDFRDRERIEANYRDVLERLRRQRSDYQRNGRSTIDDEINRLERNRDQVKRDLEETSRNQINQLEQRMRDLQESIEHDRSSSDRRLIEEQDRERQQAEDLDRSDRERQMEKERYERQKGQEEERFRRQAAMDEERFEQEKRLNEERFQQDAERQKDERAPNSGPRKPLPQRENQPARGFFTNSVSGNISDLNRLVDPTTLAVLGILLTLVATSLSLVKGN